MSLALASARGETTNLVLLTEVLVSPKPLPGQGRRNSQNFKIQLPAETNRLVTTNLLFTIADSPQKRAIRFKLATDEHHWSDWDLATLKDGSLGNRYWGNFPAVYFRNVSGATNKFTVQIYAAMGKLPPPPLLPPKRRSEPSYPPGWLAISLVTESQSQSTPKDCAAFEFKKLPADPPNFSGSHVFLDNKSSSKKLNVVVKHLRNGSWETMACNNLLPSEHRDIGIFDQQQSDTSWTIVTASFAN